MHKKMSIKDIIGISSFAIFILSIIIGIFFLALAGAFDLLGVKYDSYFELLKFVIAYLILGIILDLIAIGFIHAASFYISNKTQQFFTRMLIDCSFNWLAIFTVDEWMTSITIPIHVEILIVVVLFFMDVVFEEKKENEKTDQL